MSNSRLPHLADRADIELWADRMEARSEFPRVVRSLIQQTNDQVVELDMRGGEGVGVPGFDGRVRALRGSAFVPEGVSVWELGVSSDPQAKANSDYRARTENPAGINPAETIYVA